MTMPPGRAKGTDPRHDLANQAPTRAGKNVTDNNRRPPVGPMVNVFG